jgi:hypothetical protein
LVKEDGRSEGRAARIKRVGFCLYDEFREGNVAPAYGQKAFYMECKGWMPLGKRIRYYRSDSASYQADLFNQLEEDWKEPVRGCGYELAETVHCMNETKKAFRLVIKREVRRQGELF